MKKITFFRNKGSYLGLLLILLFAFSSIGFGQAATDLIISEYIEGGSNNKSIEIYNGTGSDIDLANYELWKIGNGGNWPESTMALSGTLVSGEVYVVSHSSSVVAILNESDLAISTTMVQFNGDDAMGLAKDNGSGTFELIDVIGTDGVDPGSGWAVAGTSNATANHTLVRKAAIQSPNANWAESAGTDASDSEWIVYAQDDFTYIGSHTMDASPNPRITAHASLTTFSYPIGSGPSDPQTFSVEGLYLSDDVVITPPVSYEISSNGTDWVANPTTISIPYATANAGEVDVYVRLKSALTAATYNEDITCTSTGATSKTVSCEGVVAPPSVTITAPNGGESWLQGSTVAITWTSAIIGNPVNVMIEVAEDGSTYSTIIASTENDGSYDWVIPVDQNIGSTYKVRVSDADDSDPTDASDAAFEIVAPPPAPELFISEVADPGDVYQGRFMELYNYSTSSIDLAAINVYLVKQSNGGSYSNVALTGTVAPGDVYVVAAYDANFTSEYGFAADQPSAAAGSTGDDAYFIYYNGDETTGILLDIYGTVDTDGTGTAWDFQDGKAVRKAYVNAPNTTWSAKEWTITIPANVADMGPGTHTVTADNTAPLATFYPANADTDVALDVNPTLTFDEDVYKADGSYFAIDEDVTSLLSFVETLTPANEVVFTATINGKVITVVPTSNLDYELSYTLTLKANSVEDAPENENAEISSSFTTLVNTAPAISNVAISEPAPYYAGDAITVTWTSANVDKVNIYVYVPATDTWELFFENIADDGSEVLTIPSGATFSEAYKIEVAYTTDTLVNNILSNIETRGVASQISELRNYHSVGHKVKLTGDVLVSFVQANRNQKFIQDASAAILIDDNAGVISSSYAAGDKMPGLEGTLSEYGNMLQFVPLANPGDATATAQTLTPVVVTLAELITNFDAYEAQLVTIEGIHFTAADGSAVFAENTVYEFTNGSENFNFKTSFAGLDYIGAVIDSNKMDVTGILNATSEGNYITSRMASEMVDNYAPVPDFGTLNGATNVNPNEDFQIIFQETVYKDAAKTAFAIDEEVTAGIKFYTGITKAAYTPLDFDFTALIAGNEISVEFNEALPFNQEIIVEIQPNYFFDINGNAAATQVMSFTTGKLTNVTFNVDMSIEFYDNAWDSTANTLDISGAYDNFAGDKLRDADGDLIYSTTISELLIGEPMEFRYRKNGAAAQELALRTYTPVDGVNELPAVFYNDAVPEERAAFEYFKLPNQANVERILTDKDSVYVTVLFGTNISGITPDFDVSPGAMVSPTTTEAQDFSSDVKYTIASYGGTVVKEWWVHVDVLTDPNHAAEIETFTFVEQTGAAVIDSDAGTISIEVAWDADITDLVPTIAISGGASINPESGVSQDFTDPFVYEVTAEDNIVKKTWTVTVTRQSVADVTFTVNMNKQINLGNFVAGSDVVNLSGPFNNLADYVCTDADADGIYSYTAANIIVGSEIAYKFKINALTELEGKPNRTHTVVAGTNNLDTVWFDDILMGTEATVSSSVYTVDDVAETIIDIPYPTDLATFKSNIVGTNGAAFVLYQADGLTLATDVATGYKLTVTSEDLSATKTYTLTQQAVADVVFAVNMNKQINLGNFVAGSDVVNLSGPFNNLADYVCTDANADGIYTYTAENIWVDSVIAYKFKINAVAELDGKPNRTHTVVAGINNLATVWFDDVLLGTETTVTSTLYTVDNVAETIIDIPYATGLAAFKSNITGVNGAAFELFQANGTTLATDVATGYKLVVTSEDLSATKTYTLTVDEEIVAGNQLIISQYYEGLSNDKWIELSNLGSTDIDLSQYYLGRWSGTDTPTGTPANGAQLTGTLAPGASMLYKNAQSALPTYCLSEGTETTATYFNGDDPVALTFGTANWEDRVDCIYGDLSNGLWGKDISFVRKATVNSANINISDFTASGEWETFTLDSVNNAVASTNVRLGYHAYVPDLTAPVATISPLNGAVDVTVSTQLSISFDELVLKSDGSEFSDNEDVASFIAFYETATPANTVAFAATISNNSITIVPTANLANQMQYTVVLAANSVEDAAGNANVETSSTFTTISASAPVITLTSPVGAEVFYAGATPTVTWTSANVTNVKIELYIPETKVWSELVASTDAGDGSETITIDAQAAYSAAYKIRVSDVANASVADSSAVFEVIAVAADITALRANAPGSKVKLTGAATVTWAQSFRGQKFIQDAGAAVLIDDDSKVIASAYVVGDQMPGFEGILGAYGGMLQFVPSTDPGAPSASGISITPKVVSLSDFVSDFEAYEAQLITFEAVEFPAADGTLAFENGTAYKVNNGNDTAAFYSNFYDVDYIGNPLPETVGTVTGLAISRTTGVYIASRDASDMVFAELPKSYSVTFSVIDENSAVVEGATVAFNGLTQITDASGQSVFTNISPVTDATYTITKGIDQYQDYTGILSVVDRDVFVDVTLLSVGIDENNSLVSNMYPNPTNGLLHIAFTQPLVSANLQICNVNGKVILNREVSQLETVLDLSGNKQGVYFITIISNDQTYQGKIILK